MTKSARPPIARGPKPWLTWLTGKTGLATKCAMYTLNSINVNTGLFGCQYSDVGHFKVTTEQGMGLDHGRENGVVKAWEFSV